MQQRKPLAEFFKLLSEPSRLDILFALRGKEVAVNDLASQLSMNQSSVSHQLAILRNRKLVDVRRSGKQKFYFVVNEDIFPLLEQGMLYLAP